MVKIRLRRVGAKKQASFRIVVADSRAPRDGRFIERIGIYNPRTEPETVEIDEERALHWLGVGAQPTESVIRLFTTYGTMARFERLKEGEDLETLLAEAEEEALAAEEEEREEPLAEAEEEPAEVEQESEVEEPQTELAEAEQASEAEEEPVEAQAEAEEEEGKQEAE